MDPFSLVRIHASDGSHSSADSQCGDPEEYENISVSKGPNHFFMIFLPSAIKNGGASLPDAEAVTTTAKCFPSSFC